MLDSVAIDFEIVLLSSIRVECRIVGFPINIGVMWGEWERGCVEGIDMCPHTILGFFGHDSFDFDLLIILLRLLTLILTLWFISLHRCFSLLMINT